MAEVRLSRAARADLVDIRLYSLDQFDAETADAYFLGFDAAFDLLAAHPLASPTVPELGAGLRCLTHRRHRIFYRAEDGAVLIVRILHHAREARLALRKAAK